MFEVSYVKEEGVSIKKHERVYAKETWYATNRFKEWYAFLWFATRHSPKRHKNVVTTYETKWNSESWVMMQNRWWKRFWQFNEMLQKAKEGKSVVYASTLWSFEIRYIQPQEHREIYFDEAEPWSDKYWHTLSVWNSKTKEWEAFPIKNLKLDVTWKRKEFIDTLCRWFDVNNVKEMSEQMQNFWCKPWENRNRKRPKTTAEALQDLNNELKKMFTEIAKHKRSFFDFALWIIVWTAIWWYFICFLWR